MNSSARTIFQRWAGHPTAYLKKNRLINTRSVRVRQPCTHTPISMENQNNVSQSSGVVVIAFGGNALLRRGEELTMEAQKRNADMAAGAVAQLQQKRDFQLCITHGNGPQVGLLSQSNPDTGLDVLDAETEGQIGYLLEMGIANALGGTSDVVTLLTQVVVDPKDPAFDHPTKPIGRWMSEEDANLVAKEKGWAVAADGDRWRRVVPSPEPRSIVEVRAIQILLQAGVIVICCGGGGIPVAENTGEGRRYGIEAVVDKDAASALLATKLKASWLIMLTDADAVYDPDKWPNEKVPLTSPLRLSDVSSRKFASGSMGPKIAAACSFIKETGGSAAVGNIEDLLAIIDGKAGTLIVPD